MILGSGSTAFAAALRAAELGKSAIVTEERTLGGTCVNRGCLPSKNLVEAARIVWDAAHPRYPGLRPATIAVDFKELIRQKDAVVHDYRDRKCNSIVEDADRIKVYSSHAALVDDHTVAMNGRSVRGDQVLIATGARPVIPRIDGLDQVPYLAAGLLAADEPQELCELPRSLVIVGGGSIALELGQMFHRFGSEVTILERSRTILPDSEPEVALALTEALRDEGVNLVTGVAAWRERHSRWRICSVTARTDAMAAQFSGDGGPFAFEPDQSRLVIGLLRALAAGAPVGAGQVAALACDHGIAPRAADRLLRRFTERDDQDAVTGFLGLSLNDHPHRFTVNGVTLSTWCALDTLFLPAMLGQTATVESASPLSGIPVRLTVSPTGVTEVQPATAVLSVVVVPAEEERLRSPEAIWTAFCHQVHFFPTRAEAERWAGERADIEILSPEEGYALGRRLFGPVLAYADDAAGAIAADGRRVSAPVRASRLGAAERSIHHAILRAFPELGGPPDGAWLSREAAARGLGLDAALAALVAEDLVQRDAATGAIVVAYPFSGVPTPHRVELAGGKPVYAMCAIDALGIPFMLGRDATVRSRDLITGEPITVTVHDDVVEWQPAGAVVFAGAVRDEGAASERQCPAINFFASQASAEAYERTHPELTNVHILDQTAAVRSAICSFGAMFATASAGVCDAQRCRC